MLFPAILWMRGLSDYLSLLRTDCLCHLWAVSSARILIASALVLVGFSLPGASRGKQECSRNVQEASGAARGAQEKRRSEREGSD